MSDHHHPKAKAASRLLDYIDQSPSPWHATETTERMLLERGFIKLHEEMRWALEFERGYYVIRDDSSIIAFRNGSVLATTMAARPTASRSERRVRTHHRGLP